MFFRDTHTSIAGTLIVTPPDTRAVQITSVPPLGIVFSIFDQVQEHLFELVCGHIEHGKVGGQVQPALDAPGWEVFIHKFHQLPNDLINLQGGDFRAGRAKSSSSLMMRAMRAIFFDDVQVPLLILARSFA